MFQFVFSLGARMLPWRKAIPVEGPASVGKIPALLKEQGVTKPLVVTDGGLIGGGIAARITDVLASAGINYAMFSAVEPNPSVNTVNAIHDMYMEEGCDGFIALGGGSPMDAAKAAAWMVRPKKGAGQLGGLLKVLHNIPPFIAVPTTAGTGSETTIAAFVSDTETHHKLAIYDLGLVPRYAILDPELTLGLPPQLGAATGMGALTNAVEAYLCWTCNTRETKRFALEAVQAIFANIEIVYASANSGDAIDGGNIAARQAMLRASYQAGFAITRAGGGNVRAIANTLGSLYNIPQGLASAIILPRVLEDYGKKVHKKLARLAEAAGLVSPGTGQSEAEKARAFIDAIYAMNRRMGIPAGFGCIKTEDIPKMIEWAGKESNPIYPVPLVYGEKRFRRIIEGLMRRTYRITEACTGCTGCVRLCPVSAISGEEGARHAINETRCVACGVCGRVCQKGAVTDAEGKTCIPLQRVKWPKPVINAGLCSACSICVKDCAPGALQISLAAFRGDIRVYAELALPHKCVGCGICEQHCPLEAISLAAAGVA